MPIRIRKYKNFDDCFFNLNREIILNPSEMLDYTHSISGYLENVYVECKNSNCSLDLSKFGYKTGKWGHLLRTYVNYDELVKFKEKLANSTALSLTFYFNQKKVNNGSCLIGIVLTREDRKEMWSKANILYRTTEVQRRFAADLVLIHHFIKELPKECCKIGKVTFYFPQMYISARVLNGYFPYFKIKESELDKSHPWIKTMLRNYELNFAPGSRVTTYASIARMQKLRLGLEEYPPIDINELSISGYFESKNGGKK